jgi:hypothetical protein
LFIKNEKQLVLLLIILLVAIKLNGLKLFLLLKLIELPEAEANYALFVILILLKSDYIQNIQLREFLDD